MVAAKINVNLKKHKSLESPLKFLKQVRIDQKKKGLKKRCVNFLIYFTVTRNNMFFNILNFLGSMFYRNSGGKVCSRKSIPRRAKKGKEVLGFLLSRIRAFFFRRVIKKLGLIFRGKLKAYKKILYRLLSNKVYQALFVGKNTSLAHGGCRPGKSRNPRSRKKRRFFFKKSKKLSLFLRKCHKNYYC